MPAFVDVAGRFVGVFVGAAPPAGSIEVASAPADARQVWLFPGWSPAPADQRIAPLAFLRRFTAAERATIRAAAAASPELADWVDQSRTAREIELGHPQTLAGLDALVAAGLISQARRAAIATTPVTVEERP